MLLYTARRLLVTVPVLWAAVTLCFVLVRAAPGDPVDIMFGPQQEMVGSQEAISEDQKDARRRELGIDRPWPEQYVAWLGRVARGDLGRSFKSRQPVLVELRQRLPATVTLAVAAFSIKLVLVLGLGIWAAVKVGTVWDHAVRLFALVLFAMPSFWLGLLLLWVFAVHFQWVTVAGPYTAGLLACLPSPSGGLPHPLGGAPPDLIAAPSSPAAPAPTRSARLLPIPR